MPAALRRAALVIKSALGGFDRRSWLAFSSALLRTPISQGRVEMPAALRTAALPIFSALVGEDTSPRIGGAFSNALLRTPIS